MDQWYGLFLGSGHSGLARRLEIQMAFLHAYMDAGQPKDMAIFSTSGFNEAAGGAHEVTLYFSPTAAAFARTLQGAAPCEKPNLENLGLEWGNWSALSQQ